MSYLHPNDNQTNDYLNRFVFKPLLGKTYCVNSGDYALYEMKSDGSPGEVLLYDESKHEDIVKLIKSKVKDKSHSDGMFSQWGCDWNEDDIDMYFGFYVYDPDTLEISKEAMIVDEAIRIDD